METKNVLGKIKEWVGLDRNPEVYFYMDQTNMRVASYVSPVLALFEVFMLINMFFYAPAHVEEGRRVAWMLSHGLSYAFLLATCVIVFLYALRFLRRGYGDHRRTVTLVTAYTIAIGAFAIYISYNDYIRHGLIFSFVGMTFAVAGMVVMNPIFSTVYMMVIYGVFFALTKTVRAPSTSLRINYIMMFVLVLVVAYTRYNERRFMAKSQAAVVRMSRYDDLTGMLNSHSLLADRAGRIGKKQFVIMADVDDFKFYNDRYGHDAGDAVIREIAMIGNELAEKRRAEAAEDEKWDLYRINGDEFCVIVEEGSPEHVAVFTREWADAVRQIERNGYTLYLTMSFGMIYGTPKDIDAMENILIHADRKMYEAKKEGGDRMLHSSIETMEKDEARKDTGMNTVYEKTDADPLTGLPTMLRFRERAQKLMVSKNENFEPYAYVFFDILNFKSYNERYGFQNGDLLIKSFAALICDVFKGSLVARFSGDQFVVVAPMDHLVDQIETVHHRVHGLQHEARLEVKAGIYRPVEGETNVSTACDRAKIVCDSIKHDYEVNYKYYDDNMMRELQRRQYIVDTIDEAIEKNYIEVYYQPVVRSISEELCGLEVLARWNDPKYGFLQPGEFIDVLEQNRLIYKIDRYVAKKACSDMRALQDEGYSLVPMSFNISRADFERADMVQMVEDAVTEHDLPKDIVHVEVTESALIDNIAYLQGEIARFHEHGYQVWMDDFGSGYSSLNTLQDFNFDVLKIDMIFLKNYGTNVRTKKILASVVDMCKKIGIHTLAEGVETREQLAFLRAIGCEKVQGYLFDKPLPISELKEKLRSGKFVCETPERHRYFETIGRVNMLSQAPMEFFTGEKKEPDVNELFGGIPLAIAECEDRKIFHYLVVNDMYLEEMRRIGRGSLEESSELINSWPEWIKDIFRNGLVTSKETGKAARAEFDVDKRHYATRMEYITSYGDREALLITLSGIDDDNIEIL